MRKKLWMALAVAGFATPVSVQADAQPSSPFFEPVNRGASDYWNLKGVVDLHTHPMAHLGFGGKVIHGAPDVDILMPRDMMHCGGESRPTSIAQALPDCKRTHHQTNLFQCAFNAAGGPIIEQIDAGAGDGQNRHGPGYPHFSGRWPTAGDVLHQQMWVDWIHRAYRGGLRVMVGLAVNNETLAVVLDGHSPRDDVAVGNRQISELKRMVRRHSWMEIAYSPSDLRRIVSSDRLAVIIGVEVDDIGNFSGRSVPPSDLDIKREVDRLHDLGVRYIFPVHLSDNRFAGAAIYNDLFSITSRHQAGYWFNIECAPPSAGIKHLVGFPILTPLNESPQIPSCAGLPGSQDGRFGHRNRMGLTRMGRVAVESMMRRGMMIDIDHMSDHTADDVIRLSYGDGRDVYPLNSGHAGLRPRFNTDANGRVFGGGSEGDRTESQYIYIGRSGGLAGVGLSNRTPEAYGARLLAVRQAMMHHDDDEDENLSWYSGLALGTDANGLVPLGRRPSNRRNVVSFRSPPGPFRTGTRLWDFMNNGMENYGHIPEYLRHIEQFDGARGVEVIGNLFRGAERFAKMWERSLAASGRFAGSPSRTGNTRISSRTIGPFCHPNAGGGWHWGGRDFNGAGGPVMKADVALRQSDNSLYADVTLRAVRSYHGHSAERPEGPGFQARYTTRLFTPTGGAILVGPPASSTRVSLAGYRSGSAASNVVPNFGMAEVRAYPSLGDGDDLAREVRLIGDTPGPDISHDTNCRDDTQISVTLESLDLDVDYRPPTVAATSGGASVAGGRMFARCYRDGVYRRYQSFSSGTAQIQCARGDTLFVLCSHSNSRDSVRILNGGRVVGSCSATNCMGYIPIGGETQVVCDFDEYD